MRKLRDVPGGVNKNDGGVTFFLAARSDKVAENVPYCLRRRRAAPYTGRVLEPYARMAESFSDKLTLILKVLSMSRARVAAELGLDKSVVARWASGATEPSGHNLAQLSTLMARSIPGFTALDWDRDMESLAGLLGVGPTPASSSAAVRGLPLPFLDQMVATTTLRGKAYEGFYRSTRPYASQPGRFIHDHSFVRLGEDGLLRFKMSTGGVMVAGWVLLVQAQLFLLGAEFTGGSLTFGIVHGVNTPQAAVLDGLLLTANHDPGRSPAASAVVYERIRDLGDSFEADEATLMELAAANPVAPIGSVPEELQRHLARDVGPEAMKNGGDWVLRLPLSQTFSRGPDNAVSPKPGLLARTGRAKVAAMQSSPSARLEAAVEAVPRAYPGPGGALAVLRGGEILVRHAWGYANAERRIAFTPRTLFRVCSITKQFTCALALDLHADLSALDDAVRARLPRLEAPAPKATHLAHNQSGLRDYWAVAMLQGSPAEAPFGDVEAGAIVGATRSLQFAPGTRFSYVNQNFRMLGDIVAERAETNFADLLRTRIFDRVGMETAFLATDTSAMPDGATGYEGAQARGFRAAENRILWTGDAGLGASLDDMIAWERYIDATRDDPAALYSRLSTPVAFADGRPATYGFGLARATTFGRASTGHGGGLRGWRSHRQYLPAERVSVVVMFNHLANAGACGHGPCWRPFWARRRTWARPRPVAAGLARRLYRAGDGIARGSASKPGRRGRFAFGSATPPTPWTCGRTVRLDARPARA